MEVAVTSMAVAVNTLWCRTSKEAISSRRRFFVLATMYRSLPVLRNCEACCRFQYIKDGKNRNSCQRCQRPGKLAVACSLSSCIMPNGCSEPMGCSRLSLHEVQFQQLSGKRSTNCSLLCFQFWKSCSAIGISLQSRS